MKCGWCSSPVKGGQPTVLEDGSIFHFACHTVYVRNKGQPLGRLISGAFGKPGGDTRI